MTYSKPPGREVLRYMAVMPLVVSRMSGSFISHLDLCSALGAVTPKQRAMVSEAAARSGLLVRYSHGCWMRRMIVSGRDVDDGHGCSPAAGDRGLPSPSEGSPQVRGRSASPSI